MPRSHTNNEDSDDNMRVIAPYAANGVTNIERMSNGEFSGECPFCLAQGQRKPGHKTFFIRADGVLWSCKKCTEQGNTSKFMLDIFRMLAKVTLVKDLRNLSANRGGLSIRTLKTWGVGWNGRKFIYPAWKGTQIDESSSKIRLTVSDLRHYKIGSRAMACAGGKAGLIMPTKAGEADFRNTKTIYVCEGEWDGMAWWEALRDEDFHDDVVAVPGAGTFPLTCLPLFQNKDVVLLYDNDPPGQLGMEKVWHKLTGTASSLRRIKWPAEYKDHEGFDVRDLWMENVAAGTSTVSRVMEMLTSDKPGSAKSSSKENGAGGAVVIDPDAVQNEMDKIDPDGKWVDPAFVLSEYQKWLRLDQPDALDVIFGTVFANRMDVDPLWMFFVGPPGCGKSELLMSLSSAPMIHCSTGVTNHSLISGMNFGKQDPSLLPKLMNRTWIVKDFTTVLSMPQIARDEVFSILRDAYDGKIEKPFGNMVVRKYEGRFGIIAGVTNKIDSATTENVVLGERFIRYRVKQRGKVLHGKDIIMQALNNITGETQMRSDLLAIARNVLNREIRREHYPEIPKWFKERIIELAQFVAVMRGVIERERWTGSTGVIASKPSSEVATRLAKQFCTLGLGIGVYRGVKELDEDIYRILAQVGCDTCPDRAESIIKELYILGGQATAKSIAEATRFPYDTVRWVLQDLHLLGVVGKDRNLEGAYNIAKPVMNVLQRMRIYDTDRTWAKSPAKETAVIRRKKSKPMGRIEDDEA